MAIQGYYDAHGKTLELMRRFHNYMDDTSQRNLFDTISHADVNDLVELVAYYVENINEIEFGEVPEDADKTKPTPMNTLVVDGVETDMDERGRYTRIVVGVSSHYFSGRTGIAIRRAWDGSGEHAFVEIADWADRSNAQPFMLAFERWLDRFDSRI